MKEKRYKINKDFGIICETCNDYYNVKIVQLGLPFDLPLEEYSKIKSSDEANKIFKQLVDKYKYIIIDFI